MKTLKAKTLISLLSATSLIACKDLGEQGSSKSDVETNKSSRPEAGNPSSAENTPSDSSGKLGGVSLRFSSMIMPVLGLNDEPMTAEDTAVSQGAIPSTLKLSDNLVISEARFSIAAIKLKPAKELSPEEKDAEAVANAEDEVATQELDQLMDQADAEAEASQSDSDLNLQTNKKGQFLSGQQGSTKTTSNKNGHDSITENPESDVELDSMATENTDQVVAAAQAKKEIKARLDGRKQKLEANSEKLKADEKARIEQDAKRDLAVRWQGPYLYDAITGTMTGDMPVAEFLDGSYRRMEFKLRRNFDDLGGSVFIIKGSLSTDESSKAIPFEINWNSALNLRLTSDSPYTVVSEAENNLTVAFNLAAWFDGIDLELADKDSDGTIRISRKSNQEIMQILNKNIRKSLHFGKDSDADGKLSDTETVGTGEEPQDVAAQ